MLNYNDQSYQKLQEASQKYLWYPFTPMQEFIKEDLVIIKEGKGNVLVDVNGNEYLDGVSSLWTNVHGHRKERLNEAIKKQLDLISHSTLLGLSNIPAIECAKRLVELVPNGLMKVFYSDNGSTAMEVALKMSYQFQQQSPEGNPKKRKFLTLENAYHGDTIGSVSLGGIDLFHKVYESLLFETIKVPSPYCYRCQYGKERTKNDCDLFCLQRMEEDIIQKHSQEIAAVVVEPLVQGAAGILVWPEGYLRGLRKLCDQYDLLLVADEVAVGFGKTGKMFACEHESVVPDIMAVAKGISGGYLPLAATITSEKIYSAFLGDYTAQKTFFHGHTYTGNPLACAAAIANMDIFEEEKVLENLAPKIELFSKLLKSFYDLPNVGEVRQKGVMVGIELVHDRDTKKSFPYEKRIGHKVTMEARKNALIIRPLGDVIVLMPPLSITMEELKRMCEITYYSIQKILH